MEYLNIGPVPHDEDCAQVGSPDFAKLSRIETKAYIEQLQRQFPIPEEIDAYFGVKSFPHDFGTYREVVVYYDASDEAAAKFAFGVENNSPGEWDEEAKAYLESQGYKL